MFFLFSIRSGKRFAVPYDPTDSVKLQMGCGRSPTSRKSRDVGHPIRGGHEFSRALSAKIRWALAPEGFVALFTKHEAAQLVPQLLDLLRVAGVAETFRQLEECFLFFLLGFDSLLDEFHKHAIVAEIALPGKDLDLSGDLGRQGYASPEMLCAS